MKEMPSVFNLGMNSATTKDWLSASKGIKLLACEPAFRQLPLAKSDDPGVFSEQGPRSTARKRVSPAKAEK
jgi:hypothetical protein